jgi:hypothetical protein
MTDEQETSLRIVQLDAENVKRIRAARIRPNGSVVRIEGRNAQGKSSIIDAIAATFGGRDWKMDEPIRRGAQRAEVIAHCGDFRIERKWTRKGGDSLRIVDAKGETQRRPQSLLGSWRSALASDPIAFIRMNPSTQNEMLRRLVGIDFAGIDAEREKAYRDRTDANRDAKASRARLGAPPPKPSGGPIDLRPLRDKLDAVGESQAAHARLRMQLDALADRRISQRAAVNDLERQLADANREMGEIESEYDATKKKLDVSHPIDGREVAAELDRASAHNDAIVAYTDYTSRAADVEVLEAKAHELTRKIEQIDERKQKMLSEANYPCDGLAVGDDGPTLNGIPFSQASSAEQLRAGVAISLASKPRFRVVLIRDGSLLDSDGRAELQRIAEEFDAQIFIECVADSPTNTESAFYIEDGEIVDTKGQVKT